MFIQIYNYKFVYTKQRNKMRYEMKSFKSLTGNEVGKMKNV